MAEAPLPLAETLSSVPPPAVVLVVGEPGSGRYARLEAAAEALRHGGRRITTLKLDLDAFECSAEDPLARYLAARVRIEPALSDRATELAPLATSLLPSHLSAVVLALLVSDPTGSLDLPFEPAAALVELLRGRLPDDGWLALFARAEELTGPLATHFARLAGELPGFFLALGVAPGDEAEVRLLLPALDPTELPRFTERAIDDDPLAPLAALFDRLDLEAARELEAFLDGAALVAPNAPADVAAFLTKGASRGRDEVEALLDRVDDELAGDTAERILWDFEYAHPSFPGQPVYRFVRPELARAVLDRLAPEERRRRAAEAFERLAPALPADSRGRTRLLLHLARTAGLDVPRRRLLTELALALDGTEVAEAPRHVTALVAHGVLRPAELIALVEGTEHRWPTGRRLALVASLQGLDLTPEEEASRVLLEARFMAELGRGPEATAAARRALAAAESFSATDPRRAAATHLLGMLLAQQGDFAEASPLLGRTVEILASTPGLDPGILPGARGRHGEVLRRLGRPAEAREQFVAAHEALRAALGDAHPAVAGTLNDLALACRDLGRLDEAAAFHRQALEVHRRAFGPDHPNLALDWNNLGSLEQQRGRSAEARQAFEEAVAILRRQPDGPPQSLAVALANLAGVLFSMGETTAGCASLDEAARTAEQLFGPEHPFARDLAREAIERCGPK